MDEHSLDAKLPTDSILTTRKIGCAIFVVLVLLTFYGCFIYRMKSRVNVGVELPPAPAEIDQNKTTTFQTDRSQNASSNDGQVSTSSHNVVSSVQSKEVSRTKSKYTSKVYTYRKHSNADSSEKGKKEKNTFNSSDTTKTVEENIEENTVNKANLHRNRTIVLIVAYMRSGSTLTGSLFQEYTDAFYVFEPLHMLHNAFSRPADDKVTLKYVNGTTRNYSVSERSEVFLDEINSWLNCKIESLSTQTLTCRHHRDFTKVMMPFFYCSQGHLSTSINHVDAKLKICFRTTTSFCKEAQLWALKFIRLSMEDASKLLPLYPNMKIIHLVRDPRGIMHSRLKIQVVTAKTFKKDVKVHCSTIEKDLKVSKEILKKQPTRLKILHYEDLAENPLETAETLFKFLGLTFEKRLQDFIFEQTHALRDSSAYSTQRKNSSKTASEWRSHIDHKKATFIYKTCRTSNVILGYLPFVSSQALRNRTFPSR